MVVESIGEKVKRKNNHGAKNRMSITFVEAEESNQFAFLVPFVFHDFFFRGS